MNRRFGVFISVIISLLLAACGGNSAEPLDVPAPGPAALAEPTATVGASSPTVAAAAAETAAPLPLVGEPFSVSAADGLELQGDLFAAPGSAPRPAVILLHMLHRDRQTWLNTGLIEALNGAGYHVLTLDMRGHGATGGAMEWDLAKEDLELVWETLAALPEVDARRTAIVGASIGANMALVTAANLPAITTAVLLSPGLDYDGITTRNRVADLQHPLLIITSEEDEYAAGSSRELQEAAPDRVQLKILMGAGHGSEMFRAEPTLTSLVVSWLNEYLPPT